MKLTQKKLREVLVAGLRLRKPDFRLETWGPKINGYIISQTFKGLGDFERQKRIWDALEEEFGVNAVRQVGMLLAFTPDEWNIKLEGHENGNGKRRKRAARH